MSIDAAQEDAEAEAGARLGRQALANGTAIAVVHEVVDPQGKRRGEAIERTVGMPRSRRKDQGSQENDGESQRWRRPSWPGDAAQKSSSSAAGHERSSRRSTWSQSPHVASVERFQPYPSPHAHVRPGHDRRYAPSSYAPSSVASSSNGDDPMEHDVFPDASASTGALSPLADPHTQQVQHRRSSSLSMAPNARHLNWLGTAPQFSALANGRPSNPTDMSRPGILQGEMYEGSRTNTSTTILDDGATPLFVRSFDHRWSIR